MKTQKILTFYRVSGTWILVLILFCLMKNPAFSQEYFQLNQFIYSSHAINPAFSGIEDMVSANIGMRAQWAAILEAPRTFYFGFNGSLSGIKNAFSNKRTLRTSVPRFYKKLQYEPGYISHGVGFYLYQDSFGPFRETTGYFSYAFQYQLNRQYRISLGLSTELSNQRFREQDVSLYNPDQDIIYQQYVDGPGNISNLSLNTGVLLYGNNVFIGYSLHHFFRVRISANNFTESGENGLTHFVIAGINIPMGVEFQFQPSTLIKINSENQLAADLVGKIKYREIFWSGLSYRYDDAVGFLLGFIIEKRAFVSYSYEFHTNDIRTYSSGSHELVLGYRIFNDKVSKPFLW